MTNAKANPGDLTGSGTAQGGIWHLALVGFLNAEGITPDAIRWVPSDGAASTMQELVTGGVDVATPALSEGKALVESASLIDRGRCGALTFEVERRSTRP